MAYGIAVNTIFGLKNITSERVPRFVGKVLIPGSAGTSGSFTAPGGTTSSNGFAFSENPNVIVNMSGSTVSWQYADSVFYQSLNFNINIVRKL